MMMQLAKKSQEKIKKWIQKINIRTIYSFVIFSLMFLYGFLPVTFASFILVALIGIVIIKMVICREIIITPSLILILIFGFLYFIFSAINYGISLENFVKFCIAPAGMYEVGINILRTYKNKQKAFLDTIFAVSLGFALYVTLCFAYRTLQFGLISNARVYIDIWNNSFMASTGAGIRIFLINALIFPVLFLKSTDKRWYHIAGVIIFGVTSIWCAMAVSNRAQIIVLGCGLLIGALLVAMTNRKHRKALLASIIMILAISIAAVVMHKTKFLGFDQIVLKIPLLDRVFNEGSLFESERFDIYIAFFKQFLNYPFGGRKIDLPNTTFCHNVWFDIYYYVGVFPATAFLILTFVFIRKVTIINILDKNLSNKTLITCCFYSFLLVFLIESVIQGSTYIFLSFFILLGSIDYFYYQNTSEHVLRYTRKLPEDGKISLVFISNYLSQHQYAFCRELIKIYGDRFKFIAVTKFNDKRIGLENYSDEFKDYILEMQDKTQYEKAQACIKNADVIIAGNTPRKILLSQLKMGKLVFRYNERLYKTANLFAYLRPEVIYNQIFTSYCLTNYRYYFLCASAYTSFDISRFMINDKRCFKWGYFVDESPYDTFDELLINKNQQDITEILFVNRLIPLKHPEKCITLANYLKSKNILFKIKIVGLGIMEQQLRDDIEKYSLQNCVELLGKMSNHNVLEAMKHSNIVVAFSDYCEGWGVCINEAMTAGCAVVASHSHGATAYLINHDVNGIIYNFESDNEMLNHIEQLCLNREKVELLGKNAFETMKTTWSAKSATPKLVEVINCMINNTPVVKEEGNGPMSLANIHTHDWFRKKKKNTMNVAVFDKPVEQGDVTSKEQIKKGAMVSYISVLLNFVSALLYTPWMIKIIGDANYSIYILAMSIIGMFAMDIGLGSALAKFLAKYRAENNTEKANQFLGLIYKIFLIINVCILVILTVLFIFIEQIYGNTYQDPETMHRFKVVFAVVGLYTIIAFAARPLTSILAANEKFAFQKVVDLIHRIIVIVIVVVALILGGGLYAVVFANVISGFACILLRYIYVKRKIKIKPNFAYKDKAMLQEIFKFSIWVTVVALAARLIMTVTPNVISWITSDEMQVNIWGIAATIEGYIFTFSAVLDGMFLPRFSQMRKKNLTSKEYTNVLINIGRIKLLITALLFVGFVTLGSGFIEIWMEGKYPESYIVASIILIPTLFTHMLMPADTLLIVHDKVKYTAICTIIAGVISIVSSAILAKYYGAIGSAIGISVGVIIGMVGCKCYFYYKQLGIDIVKFFKKTLLSFGLQIIACVIFGFMIEKVVPTTGWGVFAIKGAIVVSFYGLIMWFLGMNKTEKDLVESTCRPILNHIRTINEEE